MKSSQLPLLWVDPFRASVHFWDPMQNHVNPTAALALDSAAMSRVRGMMMIITTTTTRMRGVSG
jgi:hypothetical protein